jgi:hypothetical protein
MTASFDYDVFISYSSADREWAQRLDASLREPGHALKTFFDVDQIRAGDDWNARLEGSLVSSRNLVVLWTDKAKLSDWVTNEFMTFKVKAEPDKDPSRRLVFINVQGQNKAFTRFQQIASNELQDAYAGDQPAPQPSWDELIADLRAGLDPNSRPLPAPAVVLSLSQAELAGLDAKRWGWITNDFRVSKARLLSRYGEARADWKPFITPETIAEVLKSTRIELNKSMKDRRVVWRLPDDAFWDDVVEAKKFVDREFNTSELSLLVIDPVAIYHPDVYQRLMLFQQSFERGGTVIATLPPFGLPRRVTGLKSALQNRGTPYFDDYFQPMVPPRRRLVAQCALAVSDVDDIRRHLLAAAGQLAPETESQERSTYLKHGSSR